MTPLVQQAIQIFESAGIDPTELHWFDASHILRDKTEVNQDPLVDYRPPFDKSMVVWQGQSTKHQLMQMFMMVIGDDPCDGIAISLWRAPMGERLAASPILIYAVDGSLVRYTTEDDSKTLSQEEASLILGFVSSWLASLSRPRECYLPRVAPTFTNRRKIASGKSPSYSWKTVIVEAKSPAQSADSIKAPGGTHASPRQHDRRGHLRRLQSGKNVWVKACKVGDPNKGAIFHDYQIRDKNGHPDLR